MSARLRGRAPLRSPPRLRKDVTGPQRAGLGSPLRSPVLPVDTPDPGHRPDFAGSQKLTILVHLGRKKKQTADLSTLEEYRQEVKSMNKMI
jgi:hypothetical protein